MANNEQPPTNPDKLNPEEVLQTFRRDNPDITLMLGEVTTGSQVAEVPVGTIMHPATAVMVITLRATCKSLDRAKAWEQSAQSGTEKVTATGRVTAAQDAYDRALSAFEATLHELPDPEPRP